MGIYMYMGIYIYIYVVCIYIYIYMYMRMCRCVCGIYIYIYICVCRFIYIYMLLLLKFRSILNLLFQLAYWNVSSDFGRRAECEVVNLDNTPPALRWNHLLLSEAAKCVCSTDLDSP